MKINFSILLLAFLQSACSLEIDYQPVVDFPNSTVQFSLDQEPYSNLSSYQFFSEDIKLHNPVEGVFTYQPINALFSDYAKKKRFIWLPPNSKSAYVSASKIIDFPLGSIIIKTFYFDNVLPELSQRLIETRLLIRSSTGWQFANYIWNDSQTDAVLDLSGSYTNVQWQDGGELREVSYRIPSEAECLTCHKTAETATPIGPKPMNLNSSYSYDSGVENQLSHLVDNGYLESNLPDNIPAVASYTDEVIPLEDRVRGYLDINCAHCHSDEAHCAYRDIRLDYMSTADSQNMGVCVVQDTQIDPSLSHIVTPNNPMRSVLYFRMNSTEEEYRMPLLGRSVVDEEGLQLIEDWINSLEVNCE